MNPNLEHLIVLQAQDLELQRLRRDLQAIPGRVDAARRASTEAATADSANRVAQEAEEKLRRDQEREIASQKEKLRRLQRSLDSATSAAQVSAFEHEMSFATQIIGRLEEEEFASLERSETLEAEATRWKAETARTQRGLQDEEERGRQATQEHRASLAGIEQQRLDLRKGIEEPWLGTYDRLAKSRGTALAEALGNATAGKCAACQMAVRPQRWQDLTSRDHDDEMFACESCGRLLFWDPRRDTPKAWEAGDRLRRASAPSENRSTR